VTFRDDSFDVDVVGLDEGFEEFVREAWGMSCGRFFILACVLAERIE